MSKKIKMVLISKEKLQKIISEAGAQALMVIAEMFILSFMLLRSFAGKTSSSILRPSAVLNMVQAVLKAQIQYSCQVLSWQDPH